jgi:hypothetical protein
MMSECWKKTEIKNLIKCPLDQMSPGVKKYVKFFLATFLMGVRYAKRRGGEKFSTLLVFYRLDI